MDVTKIPFVEKIGVVKQANGELELPFIPSNHNHLATLHASAQFALAETASGKILQDLFPELVGKVIPVLRSSQIKFRKPAQSSVIARPSVSDEAMQTFRQQYDKKGRAMITVMVDVQDNNNEVTTSGEFTWFVQKLE